MTVQELIDKLNEIDNKDVQVYVFDYDIREITMIDVLDDRVDLNIDYEE